MSDQKQLFLFGQSLPPGNDTMLIDRIKDCSNYRNRNGTQSIKALEDLPADNIQQIVVGNNHVAFLLKDNRVARLSFEIVETKVESSEKISAAAPTSTTAASVLENAAAANARPTTDNGNSMPSSYAAAASAAANRTAKIRRVMMAARRPGGFGGRAGVIVDRARPMIPASSIPEELIAQAQVVLQGKSREAIVRELQRTNLNVNEAVNNLLSRDEEDADEMEDGTDAYLPEELLSLLDAGLRSDGAAAILDHDNIYATGEGYEYLIARDMARRRTERMDSKTKDRAREPESSTVYQDRFVFGDSLHYWNDAKESPFPTGVKKFVKIVAMHSELLALADNGLLYGWSWENTAKGSKSPHPINSKFFGSQKNEQITDIEACAWRAVIITDLLRVGSFMDLMGCGKKLSDSFFCPLVQLPAGETVVSLHVSPLFAAICFSNNSVYWWGVYPFNERRKLWERARSRSRKHVTFDTSEIVLGSEVRTKSNPIYAAGSVAVNFSSGTPQIGTLMESAWTLNETCRFRVQTPEQFDKTTDEKPNQLSLRKRAAPSDEATSASATTTSGSSAPSIIKESAWSLKDVIFIREESVNDTAIVKLIDGAQCGIIYKSTLEKEADSMTSSELLSKMRIIRKDDLVLVSPNNKIPRSPENFERSLKEIHMPQGVRRIIAMAIDNTGFRILAEKRGRAHLLRISCLGKLLSDHLIPLNLQILCSSTSGTAEKSSRPALENYGDESMLFLRDANGAIVPLIRNALGGYREPTFIGMSPMYSFSIGLKYLKSSADVSSAILSSAPIANVTSANARIAHGKYANRMALVAALVAPSPESVQPQVQSIMQLILYCDVQGVKDTLDILAKDEIDEKTKRRIIVETRIDGNRTIFHAAIMFAFATSNKDQADVESGTVAGSSKEGESFDTAAADAARAEYDEKWKSMVRGASQPGETTSAVSNYVRDLVVKVAESVQELGEGITTGLPQEDEAMPSVSIPAPRVVPKPTSQNKERQANAIEIIRILANHPVIREKYFCELMAVRDINGQTPLMCAVQNRAYTAASVLWNAIEESYPNFAKSQLSSIALPNNSRADDSPLFVLCYNDTCSFTWTGDEHINQDIFECKTCGLTGTLCCCTECAFTCHRNHDCKLKRTSPTAYCDCWEKCPCKALVTGNEVQREALLRKMIEKTDLISSVNGRGEHLLLFLARTVGRQLVEQDNFIRRLAKIRSAQPTTTNEVPERDLEPPKFSRKAFQFCLQNWSAVKSLISIGMKHLSEDTPINEEIFHLSEQHGSTHLDKFVFILLARCQESHLDALLNTLISEANRSSSRDPEVDTIISRFIRSVVRLFSLISVLSPAAAGITIAAIASLFDSEPGVNKFSTSTSGAPPSATGATSAAKTIVSNYRAVSISGMLSLVRTSLPVSLAGSSMKENKKKNLTSFVLKCRRIFQVLISYSLNELINTMDALMSPVTCGIVQPTALASRGISSNADVLEIMEKYLNVEQDFSSQLLGADESQKLYRRRRLETRRDTEEETAANANDTIGSQEVGAETNNQSPESGEDSDSESDADIQSRRFDSQGSLGGGHADEAHESADRDGNRRPDYGDSTDSLSSASDDDEDDASDDDDDDEDRRRGGDYNDDEEDFYEEEDEEGGVVYDGDSINVRYEDSSEGEENPYGEDDEFDEENQNAANEETEAAADPNSNHMHSSDDHRQRRGSSGRRNRRGGRSRHSRSRSNNDELIPERNDVDIPISDAPLLPPGEPNEAGLELNIPRREEIDQNAVVVVNPVSFDLTSDSNQMDTSHPLVPPPEPRETAQAGETFHTPPQSFREDEISPWDNIAPGNSSRTSTAPSLNWAVRRVRSDGTSSAFRDEPPPTNRANEIDNSESSAPEARATTNAPDTTGPPPGTSRHNRNKEPSGSGEEFHSSTNKSDMQLTVAFSILLKLVDELMLQLAQHKEWKSMEQAGIAELLNLDSNVTNIFRELLETRLESSWNWLKSVMDKTEAQLKFGNALSTSPVGHLINYETEVPSTEAKKSETGEKRYRKKMDLNTLKKGSLEDHSASSSTRKDFCSYFMSLMRSHSAENGDALPIIEYKALRSVAFVAEAFLFHINALEILETKISNTDDISMMDVDEDTTDLKPDGKSLRRFYQRSNSVCYPYISAADSHHAFKYASGECLPLAARPHLLQPLADKSALFALPLPLRTKKGHRQVAVEHRIDYPTHHSFANPPSNYENVLRGNIKGPETSRVSKPKEAEQRPNVIVHSSDVTNVDNFDVETVFGVPTSVARISLQKYLGRWSNTLLFMSKAFHEELTNFCGGDASFSVLLMETAGFHVRQSQFRKKMEKFKMAQTKDLTFSQMSRDKTSLLIQTMRQLNQQYARRISSNSTTASPSGSTATFSALKAAARGIENLPPNNPPLASSKIKVTFLDEPGEGTGVARSFYTAVADAFLTMTQLPSEGSSLSGDLGTDFSDPTGTNRSTSPTFQLLSRFSRRSKTQSEDTSGGSLSNALPPSISSEDRGVRTRSQKATVNQASSASATPVSSSRKYSKKAKYPLTLTAPAYYPRTEGTQEGGEPAQDRSSEPPLSGFQLVGQSSSSSVASAPPSTRSRQTEMNTMLLGDRILAKVRALQPEYANKITGMFLFLPLTQVMSLISNEENFRAHVEEATELLKQTGFGTPGATELKDETRLGDNAPLFFRPARGGYYTPIAANNSPQRLAAFRNAGRMMGIALQQMEIFPLHICRHVLKYILSRQITWFDLAFYDPAMFDSLRSIVYNDAENTAHSNEFYESLQLTFAVDLSPEEGGGVIELKPDGESIPVTRENVLEYIYLFVQSRLLGTHVKALEAIRQGVFDVIPPESLANLTAEDLRLILCGTHDVSIPLLKSYTTFLDESSAPPDVLSKFKETFWSTVEKFSLDEKSDLIFFWHGSFTLPSSEESFQPLPTIMIRPADDHHLPTANTCISRLYIPLYSSKKILRSKLLLAIKARNFGFV